MGTSNLQAPFNLVWLGVGKVNDYIEANNPCWGVVVRHGE